MGVVREDGISAILETVEGLQKNLDQMPEGDNAKNDASAQDHNISFEDVERVIEAYKDVLKEIEEKGLKIVSDEEILQKVADGLQQEKPSGDFVRDPDANALDNENSIVEPRRFLPLEDAAESIIEGAAKGLENLTGYAFPDREISSTTDEAPSIGSEVSPDEPDPNANIDTDAPPSKLDDLKLDGAFEKAAANPTEEAAAPAPTNVLEGPGQ